MKAISYVGLVLGLALATVLVVRAGADTVVEALSRAEWNVGWLALFYLVPLTLAASGWRQLLVDVKPPSLAAAMRCVWIGVAVNWLLPAAQVGGELVRARLAMKGGISGAAAGASVVIDKTVQATNVVIFGLLGLVLFIVLTGNMKVLPAVIAFLFVLAALIFAFYRIQRAGMFGYLANRLPGLARHKTWEQLVGGAEALDESIRAVYGQPRRIVLACMLRLMGRLMLAGELWLALYFLGYRASLVEVVMLESLTQAVRGGTFFVPGALGVQEGSFMVLAPFIGLAPETGLAVSLVKRARELLVGVPALVAWQVSEGRWLWRSRQSAR